MSQGNFHKPRVRHSFVIERIDDEVVFFLSEHRQLVFEGNIFSRLVELLNGQNEFSDILNRLKSDFSIQAIYQAINRLARSGCLAESDNSEPSSENAFWDYVSPAPQRARDKLRDAAVEVRTIGVDCQDEFARALAKVGIECREGAPLLVVATDDYLRPEIGLINRECLEFGRSWMLVKPVGMVLWIGPYFRGRETGCWACLEHRLRHNRQFEFYIEKRAASPVRMETSKSRFPGTLKAGISFATLEIARAIALDETLNLNDRLLTFDLVRFRLEPHTLVKRPQCPVCGIASASQARGPVVLDASEQRASRTTDHRVATPRETFDRYQHHISPVTGIVTSFKSRDESQSGLTHNYVAGHYFPLFGDDLTLLRVNTLARSGGKGTTELQAKTSALCESLERYSGIFWGDEERVESSFGDLRDTAIRVQELLLFSPRQYDQREPNAGNALSDQHYVPEPLDDSSVISWTPVWSLTKECARHVPTAYCYYGFRDPNHFFCRCDSNGCAAGNSLAEAFVHGFLELVERDSVAMWWYNQVRRPAVDVASFSLPIWGRMKAWYERELDRDLHVIDITSDLGIPVFVVVSRRTDREVEDVIVGFGAHLNPQTAMMRALNEANQYLPALRHRNPDGSTRYQLSPPEVIEWWRTATYQRQTYLVPDPLAQAKCLTDFVSLTTGDVADDAQVCVRRARECGLEVLVLDQTRPDVGLPVARVIVPGLRHFWRRLGPGRLYDVPVQIGWLLNPLAEEQMNPVSCFV